MAAQTISIQRPVHQGFLLDCSPLNFELLQSLPDADGQDPHPVWLALDEVYDPVRDRSDRRGVPTVCGMQHNLGAMLRTAAFLGVNGVVVAQKNSAPLSPTVSKVSSGAMETFPVHASSRMQRLLSQARGCGWHVLGSDVTDDAISFEQCTVDAPTVLVMGKTFIAQAQWVDVVHCSRKRIPGSPSEHPRAV